jgi:phage shock protein C
MADQRRLTRSENDRILVGVCGGLGEHFGIDPTIVRIAFVLLAVFGGSGVVLYLALWLIVPRASIADAAPRDVVSDGVTEGRRLAREGADAAKRGYRRMRGTEAGPASGGPADEAPPGTDPGAPPSADPGAPPSAPSADPGAPPASTAPGAPPASTPPGEPPGSTAPGDVARDEPAWPDPNPGGPPA